MCLVKVVPDQTLGIVVKGEEIKKTEVDAVVAKIKAEGYAYQNGGVTKHIMPNAIKFITVKDV